MKIVRMQTSYIKLFPTKTKVPMLFYLETINEDDSQELTPEWEKDFLYQQIYYKIKLENEIFSNQKQEEMSNGTHKKNGLNKKIHGDLIGDQKKKRYNSTPVRIKRNKRKKIDQNNNSNSNPNNIKIKLNKKEIYGDLKIINLVLETSKKKKLKKIEIDYIEKLKNILKYKNKI